MYEYHWDSREDRAYFDRAIQDRIEAQARAVDLMVAGVESVVAFVARPALAGVRRIARSYADRRRRRQAIRELSRLDDRLLRDIGVQPGEIHAIVNGLTYEDDLTADRPAAVPKPARAVPAPVPGPTASPAPAALPAAQAVVPALRLDLDCLHRKPSAGATGLAA